MERKRDRLNKVAIGPKTNANDQPNFNKIVRLEMSLAPYKSLQDPEMGCIVFVRELTRVRVGVLTVFIIFPSNYIIFVDFLCKNKFHPKILKVRMNVMKLTYLENFSMEENEPEKDVASFNKQL